jgi:hypothetical protein
VQDPTSQLDPIRVRFSGYVQLNKILDGHDGSLCVIDAMKSVPFEIKRVYFINNLENCVSIRGKHAHRALTQVIFCISGSFVLGLDDGQEKQEVHMFRDNVGVVLGPGLWHTMHSFSSGCVLLVAASDHYDESDYIRDYDEFLAYSRRDS